MQILNRSRFPLKAELIGIKLRIFVCAQNVNVIRRVQITLLTLDLQNAVIFYKKLSGKCVSSRKSSFLGKDLFKI